MRIIILSGMSGSGKSTAVKALEDEGFYCIDNLPVRLFRPFVDLIVKSGESFKGIVLVADIRGREFFKGYESSFKKIEAAGHHIEVIFIDAIDEVLLRRFSETRRRHPATNEGTVLDGIKTERQQLAGLRLLAGRIIDSSELTVHQLKEQIIRIVRGDSSQNSLIIEVQSFGFRYGIPLESNIVMDVRFLPNPYFIPELKNGSGLDDAVRDYILSNSQTASFINCFFPMLVMMIPAHQHEGKAYLTISIGCTGGRHRSVALAEATGMYLKEQFGSVRITHRDIDKGL